MKKYIKKLLKDVLYEVIEDKMPRIARISANEAFRDLFSYIGIQRMEQMIEEIKKRPKGYEDYTSLAEMFSQIQRGNLARENSEIIHNYFELQPKLNQYANSLNKVVEDTQI